MMKMLRKKRKGGFTLIELIVVIAILGILALIAIPRFAGFTDKAKQANDDQYLALYENAITVLLADETITSIGASGNTITFAVGTGVPTVGAGIGGATADDFTDLIKTTPFQYYTSAVITITNTDGDVTYALAP